MAMHPDDLCPHCGVPVPRAWRRGACPHCRTPFAEPPQPTAGNRLTPFGHGVCGVVIGTQIGAAVALSDPEIRLGDPRLTLFPILGAAAFSVAAAWIGRRLVPEARRGYDICLAATVCGAFTAAVASLMGLSSVEALVALGGCVTVLAGAIIRSRMLRQKTTGGITREC